MCMTVLSTSELRPAELTFVRAMRELGFGQFECVRIIAGKLALDPVASRGAIRKVRRRGIPGK